MSCQGPEPSLADLSLADLVTDAKEIAKTLTVAELKNVLRQEGLHVSGVKSELQIRIITRIEFARNDRKAVERIRSRMFPNRHVPYPNSYPSPFSNRTPTSSLSPQYAPTPSRLPPSTSGYTTSAQRNPTSSVRVSFPDSPFYTIRYPLSHVHECKVREATRDTASLNITLLQNTLDEIERSNAGVMVFCAAEGRPSEITFPHQVELKVNGNEVKTNLRGLKNKPGSTRPADITKYMRRKTPGLSNTVEMTYALTTKDKNASQKFHLVVNLVQRKSVDSLVQELRQGLSISKEQVIRDFQRQAADPDIIATSSVMSLKCPLSYMRIKTPCRGTGCRHNQCFDASSYLQLQEQAPTWTCPICNKTAAWEHLVLDRYMQDILQSTSESTEEVTIEPDGTWHLGKADDHSGMNGNRNPTPTTSTSGDSDDAVEIVDDTSTNTQAIHRDLSAIALTPKSINTPSISSQSIAQAVSITPASHSRSNKRPAADFIDLTVSDNDDDDEPPLKRQRPSLSSGSTSFHRRPPDLSVSNIGTSTGGGFSFTMPPTSSPMPSHQHANHSATSTLNFGSRYGSSY